MVFEVSMGRLAILRNSHMGHSIPNQQKKSRLSWIFILKYHFSQHMFNKMAITSLVIVIKLFRLDFWNTS